MPKLRVIRTDVGYIKTYGLLEVDGEFVCHTLEDKDRKLEQFPTCKVYGETAIPRGIYTVVLDFSYRFKENLPHVLGVPCFDAIRIHAGNTVADTHGCVLVGTLRTPGGLVGSRKALDKLLKLLASKPGEITLEVM